MAAKKANHDAIRGSLDLMVLSVLAEGPQYGYRILQRLSEVSEGTVDLKPGTLYPMLHRLETDKLIKARWEKESTRPRKWYELTKLGRSRLAEQAREWEHYAKILRQLLEPILRQAPGCSARAA